MERIIERGMLFDFYGELLTEHQKSIYGELVYNDMSLAEIAEEYGISRQAVHDLIRRCDKMLEDYEKRLGLMEKFKGICELAEKINILSDNPEVRELACRIISEL